MAAIGRVPLQGRRIDRRYWNHRGFYGRRRRSWAMNGQLAMSLKIGGAPSGARRSPHTGYQEAFVGAYQLYYTKVFAYVYSRVGNVEVAKDLAAEVFEKAYVKGHTVREPAAYGTWLFMIAKNVVIGHYRRQKRENNGIDKVKESLWLSEQPRDPEDS